MLHSHLKVGRKHSYINIVLASYVYSPWGVDCSKHTVCCF